MKAYLGLLLIYSSVSLAQMAPAILSESRAPARDHVEAHGPVYPSRTTLPVGDGSAQVGVVRSQGTYVGFEFNTRGANGGQRTYNFEFPERARQGIRLRITDDAQIAGAGLSANLLETSIYFFPRRVVPSVTAQNGSLLVTLPTGEIMEVDTASQRLSGALVETAPQDTNPNRHARRFAALNYTGTGLTIRVDRRAGIPEEVYTQSFNSNEDITNAIVSYRGRTCRIRKDQLFQQGETTNSYPLFADDASLFQLIATRCGWRDLPVIDVTALDEVRALEAPGSRSKNCR